MLSQTRIYFFKVILIFLLTKSFISMNIYKKERLPIFLSQDGLHCHKYFAGMIMQVLTFFSL